MYFSFLLLILTISRTHSSPQCLNHLNNSVEWFFLYKLPKSSNTTGKEYMYLSDSQLWYGEGIDEFNSPLRTTLSQQILNSSSLLFYNDQKDNQKLTEQSHGHMKGIISFDQTKNGFWIVHSIPHLPLMNKPFWQYPNSGLQFGQSVFCVSLQNLDLVLNLMSYAKPQYVYQNLNKKMTLANGSITVDLKSSKGRTLVGFAKSATEHFDIYTDLISAHFRQEMLVETWRHGPDPDLPSNCSTAHHVLNINDIGLMNQTNQSIFHYTSDHSKWAIGAGRSSELFCIGDLNRQEAQLRRGGSSLCIEDKRLRDVLFESIIKVESCPLRSSSKRYNVFGFYISIGFFYSLFFL